MGAESQARDWQVSGQSPPRKANKEAIMQDAFGDRMKAYESIETGNRFIPLLPIYVRLDGKCFSKFTSTMKRPFDEDMSRVMIDVTRRIVKETGALAGYTQSDEISLLLYSDTSETQVYFDGKKQKLVSVLAAMATSYFITEANKHWPQLIEKAPPMFDCRAINLPTRMEATNMFLWRARDATKNAVSMAARSLFSHNQLHGKSSHEMREMMLTVRDVDFDEYPEFFRFGTFVQRRKVFKELPEETLSKIPEQFRPTGPIERTEIVDFQVNFGQLDNRVEMLFEGQKPILREEDD